jgi:hypothetical protein
MSDRFFVGWSAASARPLAGFLAAVVLALVGGFAALGLALGAGADDPAAGLIGLAPPERIAPETPEERRVEGVLERGPSPILRLDPTPAHPQGEALLMAFWTKLGIDPDPALYGRRVAAQGWLFRRGDIGMLVHGGDFAPLDGQAPPAPVAEPLGRWRVTGEICDGKCYAGVMKPGSGLSHRACAQLCILGGVPAVFVAAEPVAGTRFFLLADAAGGPPPREARRLYGVPVALEGALERRGSLLVFRVDFDRARLL